MQFSLNGKLKNLLSNKLFLKPILFLFCAGFLFLVFAKPGWGADQNIYIDSTAAGGGNGSIGSPYNTLASINWTTIGNWTAAGDDVFINLKRGSVFRERVTMGASGTAGHHIAFRPYSTGNIPEITGLLPTVAGNWTDNGNGTWQTTTLGGGTAVNFVRFGGIWGAKQSAVGDLAYSRDWAWATTPSRVVIKCPAGTNPITYYGSVDIVIGSGANTNIYMNSKNYFTFEGIRFSYWDNQAIASLPASAVLYFYYCQFDGIVPTTSGQAIQFPATAVDIRMYNCDIMRNYNGIQTVTTAAVNIRNCRFYGNRNFGLASGGVNTSVSNSHFFGNNIYGLTHINILGSYTNGGGNIADRTWPAITEYKVYPALLGLSYDDSASGNETQFDSCLDDISPHKASIASVTRSSDSASYKAWLQEKFDAGQDIVSHGYSHVYLNTLNAFVIRYVGAGAAATMTISGNVLTTSVDGAPDLSLDLTNASYDTVAELVAYIDALPNYTCTISSQMPGAARPKSLADIAAQDIKISAYTASFDKTRATTNETAEAKSDLESWVTDLTVTSHVYAGAQEDATTEAAAAAVGITAARGSANRSGKYDQILGKGVNVQDILSGGLEDITPKTDGGFREQIWISRLWGQPVSLYEHPNGQSLSSVQRQTMAAAITDLIGPALTLKQIGVALLSKSQVRATTYRASAPDANVDWQSTASSPTVDAGALSDQTTDLLGNPIYGLPDIGAYENQPPYDMGTNEVDIAANVRVYGDGKFQNTETAGGTTADLSVIPQGSQTTKWLDITKADDESAIIWEAIHKKWKESSTTLGATNTLHTVGDLTVGKAYSLRIDDALATANITSSDCASGICTADEFGKITFTYTGGYSNHTFDIDDDIPPVITITSPETGGTVSGDDTITFTDTEQTDPECSIDNSAWVNCTSSVTSFSDLTNWNDISESDTFTLYMRDTDGSGNIGTTNVANLTKADTQAPVRSSGYPSGELSSDTSSATLSLATNESAICKYSTTSGTAYASMTESLTTSNGTTHSATVSGLSSENSYSYYIRCQDQSGNASDTDYLISFSVANAENQDQDNDENTDNNTDEENIDNKKDLNVHSVKAESTEDTITITWKTDHNAKSSVRYGVDKDLKQKEKDKEKEKKHKIVLKDLLSDTKYYFRIKAEDSDDNEDSSRIHSIVTKSVPTSNPIPSRSSDENMDQVPTENTTASTNSENTNANVCAYTVESGDTLWGIAKKVYSDATDYPQIVEENKDKYPDIESKLSIGQELTFDCKNNTDLNTDTNTPSQQVQGAEAQEPQETSNFKWYNPFSWF